MSCVSTMLFFRLKNTQKNLKPGVGFSPLITPFLSAKKLIICKANTQKNQAVKLKTISICFQCIFFDKFPFICSTSDRTLEHSFLILSALFHLVKDALQQHLLNKIIIFFIPYFIFFYFHLALFYIIKFTRIIFIPFKII